MTASELDVERAQAHLAAAPLRELATQPQGGLVLVSGPPRSGRSTSLAAIVDARMKTAPHHVLVVTSSEQQSAALDALPHPLLQRRRAQDQPLARVLGGALQRDLDALVLDELDEPAAIELALLAASAGSLVLAAVAGSDCVDALQRLSRVAAAPIAGRLAACLRLVSCQRLLRARDGSRRVAREVLVRGPELSAALRQGDLGSLRTSAFAAPRAPTLDAALDALVHAGAIDAAEAYAHARDPRPFAQRAARES